MEGMQVPCGLKCRKRNLMNRIFENPEDSDGSGTSEISSLSEKECVLPKSSRFSLSRKSLKRRARDIEYGNNFDNRDSHNNNNNNHHIQVRKSAHASGAKRN